MLHLGYASTQKHNVILAFNTCCMLECCTVLMQLYSCKLSAMKPDNLIHLSQFVPQVKALAAAGAHIISTDFPSLPTYFNSSYQVTTLLSSSSTQSTSAHRMVQHSVWLP